MTDLVELRLNGTRITDDGLATLVKELGQTEPATLLRLDLRDTDVEDDGVTHLQIKMPEVVVTR